ncbi:MAG: metallophosphoesterase [bacterium]|nr:metallophosphoesterase [bacterium]
MHLGRLPARVPVEVMGGRLPALAELGPGAAWLRTARHAVRLGVDAVALAGDVVHGANDLFEGANELAKGLEILATARIPVVAVAGNHDTRVLPDLARRGGITLLGPDGTWSAFDLAPAGRAPVRLVGWSFPAPHWEASPLQTPPPPAAPGLVTLGLLHGDLDVPAAVTRRSPAPGLATGYTAWLLATCTARRSRPSPFSTSVRSSAWIPPRPAATARCWRGSAATVDSVLAAALAPLAWLHRTWMWARRKRRRVTCPRWYAAPWKTPSGRAGRPRRCAAVGVRLTLRGAVAGPATVRRALPPCWSMVRTLS